MSNEGKPGWESKPKGYSRTTTKHDALNQRTNIARKRRGHMPLTPDVRSCELAGNSNITGRYEDEQGVLSIGINQAGRHIECFIAFAVNATFTGERKLYRYSGYLLKKDGVTFNLFESPQVIYTELQLDEDDIAEEEKIPIEDRPPLQKPSKVGEIKVLGIERLTLFINEFSTQPVNLVLNEPLPTVSEVAIEAIYCKNDDTQQRQWFPLVRRYLEWLARRLSPQEIGPYIDEFMDESGFSNSFVIRQNRRKIAQRLDDRIGLIFTTDVNVYEYAWHTSDLGLARTMGKEYVCSFSYKYDQVTAPLAYWLNSILDIVRMECPGYLDVDTLMPNLGNHLGIKSLAQRLTEDASAYREPFYYEINIYSTGLAASFFFVGCGGFHMEVTVKKWKTKDDYNRREDGIKPAAIWPYTGAAGEISFGAAVEVTVGRTFNYGVESHVEYLKTDIPGFIQIFSGGAGAGLGIGVSAGTSFIEITGNGTKPKLTGGSVGVGMELKIGGGAGSASTSGRIFEPNFDETQVAPDYIRKQEKNYSRIYKQNAIYFALGDAFLSDIAVASLRYLCASELCVFADPGSRLYAKGYADRIDTPKRNIDLSLSRAENVYRTILNILLSQLRITEEKQLIRQGLGEKEAAKTDKDKTANPEFRKVLLVLNGYLVFQFKGDKDVKKK